MLGVPGASGRASRAIYGRMHSTVEKTTLYLPPELHRALKEAARRERKSQAELIREALARYLSEKARPPLRSIGVAEDEALTGRDAERWLEEAWRER